MRHVAWLFIGALLLAGSANAQTPKAAPLGLDLEGGYIRAVHGTESTKPSYGGWKAGATVRMVQPWFGVAGEVARSADGDASVWDIAAGPRLTSPYLSDLYGRGFVHGLVGTSHASSAGESSNGLLAVAGGGVEFAVWVRVTADYVFRSELPAARHDARLTIGGVVPLCLRNCGRWDGIQVGRK